MPRKMWVLLLAIFLVTASHALAADDTNVSGSVNIGVRAVDNNGDSAKFDEYRDLDDGGFGNFTLDAYRGHYFLQFDGTNLGLSDQSYNLNGGDYRNFKYRFFYDEIPHNLSYGAKTFYSGVGKNHLDYYATDRAKDTDTAYTPNISTDPDLWHKFDYTIKRKNYGGQVEISMDTPFFVTFGVKELETTGKKPLGDPSGVFVDRVGTQFSAFGNAVEMPEPVDYKTKDAFLQAGYHTKALKFKMTGFVSNFDNTYNTLTWRNPYVTTEAFYATTKLPPDNDYWKLAADGSVRLPLDSVLALRASYSKLNSDFTILNTIATATSGANVSPTYTLTTLGLSRSHFDGDIAYTSFSASLSSNPFEKLNVRMYYDYLDRNNDSTQVEFTNIADAISVENELFEYTKNHAGVDFTYGLPACTKADFGYEFMNIDRTRQDAEDTTDNSLFLQMRNTYFDALSAKVRYQHLWRNSDFKNGDSGASPTDPAYLDRYVRLFDATDKKQDSVKLTLDLTPIEWLDLGLEYTFRYNDYNDTVLGRTDDTRHEFYVDFLTRLPRSIQLSGFFGYEFTNDKSKHRAFNPGDSADPSADPTATAYNWKADLDGKYWSYGLTAKIPVMERRLQFIASWQYDKSNGDADFSAQQDIVSLQDINSYDDYTRKLLQAKAVYAFSPKIDITLGYLYEKYMYNDAELNGYLYVVGGSSPNTYLSGAYSDHDYEANLGYIAVGYKF